MFSEADKFLFDMTLNTNQFLLSSISKIREDDDYTQGYKDGIIDAYNLLRRDLDIPIPEEV